MSDLHIKASTPPRRCEVCHQADLFDADTNVCSRCVNISLPNPTTTTKPVKQYHQEPQKVFTNLVGSLGVISAFVFFLVYFLGINYFLQLGIPIFAIPLVGVVIANYLFLNYVKLKIVEGTADNVRFFPTKTENFQNLDLYSLERYTQSLMAIGFQPIVDVTLFMEGGMKVPGFSRTFLNIEYGCIAEVNQLFPPDQPVTPMRLVFITHFEGQLAYGSTDREPDSVSHILRKENRLSTIHTYQNASQIFNEHLQKRQFISEKLHRSMIPIQSVDEHFFIECENFKTIKPQVRSLNIFKVVIEGLIFEYFPKYEWLGNHKELTGKK
jgi:cytochrome c oxidase subunit IV